MPRKKPAATTGRGRGGKGGEGREAQGEKRGGEGVPRNQNPKKGKGGPETWEARDKGPGL